MGGGVVVRCGGCGLKIKKKERLVTLPNTGRRLSCRSLCLILGEEGKGRRRRCEGDNKDGACQ